MFRLERPHCPRCGQPPAGTIETVSGLAELVEAGDGLWEYGGYTRIDWDSQRSVARLGLVRLECPAGHRWSSRCQQT